MTSCGLSPAGSAGALQLAGQAPIPFTLWWQRRNPGAFTGLPAPRPQAHLGEQPVGSTDLIERDFEAAVPGAAAARDYLTGVTTEESAELKRLKRENAELRRANAILKTASTFFASVLDRPQH